MTMANAIEMIARCRQQQNAAIPAAQEVWTGRADEWLPASNVLARVTDEGVVEGYLPWQDREDIVNDQGSVVP